MSRVAAAGVPEGPGFETAMGNNGFELLGLPGDDVIDFGSVGRYKGSTQEGVIRLDHTLGNDSTLAAILGYSAYDYDRFLDADFNPLTPGGEYLDPDAAAAREIICSLAREYRARTCIKAKSMTSEEIEARLEPTMDRLGIESVTVSDWGLRTGLLVEALDLDPFTPREAFVEARGMKQVTDTGAIEEIIREVREKNPKQLEQYRGGQEKLFGFFMGALMRAAGGTPTLPPTLHLPLRAPVPPRPGRDTNPCCTCGTLPPSSPLGRTADLS